MRLTLVILYCITTIVAAMLDSHTSTAQSAPASNLKPFTPEAIFWRSSAHLSTTDDGTFKSRRDMYSEVC